MEEEIIKLLKDPSQPKWQTALGLNAKLSHFQNSSPEAVESMLIELVKENPDADIRYSTLPSKRNLKVLWGHKDKVGERKLFDIFKEDEEVKPGYLEDVNDERNMFLSHSFKDTKAVFRLSRALVAYGCNPWVAEADISRGQHINNEVINAISNLPFFGIYLSRNMLNSTWSAKEFEFAVRNKKKLFAFISADDQDIINLVENDVAINHLGIHELLRRVFDRSEFSERIQFFLIAENTEISFHKINLLKDIQEFI